ncbi:MAG: HipA domain-containing protein [Bacteroidales bacterium]|nr:HipA domain-containing protein [Bacteroidales bacterium]MCB8999205.1 HipA domain-containing protein [Bacteroidales bacterium]
MNKCLYCYKELKGELDFHENCSMKFFGSKTPPSLAYSLNQMNELAKDVVERSVSVPGVQAKLSMTLVKELRGLSVNRLTVVGAMGGGYILKPPSAEYPEMPQNEHVTMRIAEAFGIRVVPSSLIRLASGELSYITKRVDRKESGEKVHMIDMFQITEAYDKYKSSLEKVGRSLKMYSENTLLDSLFFFELSLFCFLSGNNDMHLKNFSMIESASGWVLAPAYDLLNVAIINPNDTEETALTLEGDKRNLNREHFKQFGKGLGLTDKQTDRVFERFLKNKDIALALIDNSFLSKKMASDYKKIFGERFERIYQ